MPKKIWIYFVYSLTLLCIVIVLSVYSDRDNDLKIIACDVGQGDAILIQKQTTQVLIDGGPDASVLGCLAKYVPFWDRKIELVVLTHPQMDHHGGLKQVFEQYAVLNYLSPGVDNSTSEAYQEYVKVVSREKSNLIDLNSSFTVNSINFDILWPNDEKVSSFVDGGDLNDYSVVLHLSYGDFDALFTGDTSPAMIDTIYSMGLFSDVEYLKVPHHGSKKGMNETMLKATTPEIAAISVGKNNRFKHPSPSVLDMLEKQRIEVYRTDILGDVVVTTDGKRYNVVK